jgi:hypothetical protein
VVVYVVVSLVLVVVRLLDSVDVNVVVALLDDRR